MISINFKKVIFCGNVLIEHAGVVISLVGHHLNTGFYHMEEMRLFRDGADITHFHPDAQNGDVYISDFKDVMGTIKLIDDGCFEDDIILLTDEV